MTLTPWDPAEMWPLVSAALARRPAVHRAVRHAAQRDRARPREAGPRPGRGGAHRRLPAARAARRKADGTLVLQESAVTLAFVADVLPRLEREGVDLDVYYVASAELFDALPPAERERIFPEARAQEAMGITGFTLRHDVPLGAAPTAAARPRCIPTSRATSPAAARARPCCTRPGSTRRRSTRPSAATST